MSRGAVLAVLLVLGSDAVAACPAFVTVRGRLPGVRAQQEQVAYWLRRRTDADTSLLSVADITAIDARGESLLDPVDVAKVRRQVASLETLARARLSEQKWLDAGGRPIDPATLPELAWEPPALDPHLRVVLAPVQLRCLPLARPLRAADDAERLDDANACSTLRPQDVVQVLAVGPGTQRLVRTRYALGWIGGAAPLSPRAPEAFATALVRGERVMAPRGVRLGPIELPARTSVPLVPDRADRVLVGTRAGVVEARRDAALVTVRRPLTRRAVFEAVFPLLGRPYGLGGTAGGIDCSALVLDAFASVGLDVPRHSSDQARAGTSTVDLRGIDDVAVRLARLDAADRQGVVVLYLPGHVALYLGRDANGVPRALHALGSYRTSCGDGSGETKHVVRRVVVSGLDLGAGTREGSLLQRLETLAVFGPPR